MLSGAACGGTASPPQPAWTEFSAGPVRDYQTLFYKQEPFELNDGQKALMGELCPRVRRGTATRANERFWMVQLEVEGSETVAKVGADLGDGDVADVGFRLRDAVMELPIACERCPIYLGVRLPDGRTAACLGSGWSLQFDRGVLTPD